MAKLNEYNGHYCESEYESAFIGFLEQEGWQYNSGNSVDRNSRRNVLIKDDFLSFLKKTQPYLEEADLENIYNKIKLIGGESDFATLHKCRCHFYHLICNIKNNIGLASIGCCTIYLSTWLIVRI